ncbi:TIGR04283 family arsenosugar biosynthesis glycosyltransferase [Sulfitobacter sp. HGT1]|uniref:TIGR04283 family arsenosugar biosynthesis glycosyltransferase n=1 Tax=Sulfitobacter sp. HGT1 TaxID=2735435 RepID=UPI001593BE14|nr:TIGR04283 family arsenosugar biosynthesis glycosyltransferase [Sulfitobacter sp. HGT1]MBQ0804959.1 TIGR04283 family arsenosugar biosynthesis glycosyltransferase [Sulfitobacter sp.]
MPAPITVIIPTLNAEHSLTDCLTALMEGVDAGLICELIVSDGGSEDATRIVADAWGAQIIEGAASRGGQLRRGCAKAKGEWLLILHADTQLAQGWTGPVIAHLKGRKAGWFQLRFDSTGFAARFVAGWANLRSRLGLPYGDQGLLLPRTLYQSLGGYPDQPLMEDVAMARLLKGHLTRIDCAAITSADKYHKAGWLRRGGRNLWSLIRYFAGVSPQDLAKAYSK